MKKIVICISLTMMLCLAGCKHDECKDVISYKKLDDRLDHYIFKRGTYWVYTNTTDGITDSQYVYSYDRQTHIRESYDSASIMVALAHGYCGQSYLDILNMKIVSYYNGVFNDTLSIAAAYGTKQGLIKAISMFEFFNQAKQLEIGAFILDPSQQRFGDIGLGFMYYMGNTSSIMLGTHTFNNVDVFRVNSYNLNAIRFKDTTDLYFARDYGLVRMADHRATGIVNWDLTKYHIEN